MPALNDSRDITKNMRPLNSQKEDVMNIAVHQTHQDCSTCEEQAQKAISKIVGDQKSVYTKGVWMVTASDTSALRYNIPDSDETCSATVMVNDYVMVFHNSQ